MNTDLIKGQQHAVSTWLRLSLNENVKAFMGSQHVPAPEWFIVSCERRSEFILMHSFIVVIGIVRACMRFKELAQSGFL